jgi:hypothetical protein
VSDDIKKVEVAITSSYDGKGAQQAVTDQEKLTNTGKGLATALPDLNAKTQAYVISSEQEYLAIQKAHDALANKLPLLQAAGKNTAEVEQTIRNLSAALSTNEALTIAESMETKSMARAKEEAVAAATAAAAAEKEEAGAHAMNATAMRESMVIMRELQAGRLSRIPGSISILASQFSALTPAMTAGLFGVSSAAFVLWGWLDKIIEDTQKLRQEVAEIDVKVWEDQASGARDGALYLEKYRGEIEQIEAKQNAWRAATDEENASLSEQRSQIDAIIQAEEQRDLARAKGDPAQQEAIRLKYEALRREAEIQEQILKLESDRDALAQARANREQAKAESDAAAVAVAQAKANVPDAVNLAKEQKGMLQSNLDSAANALLFATGSKSLTDAFAVLAAWKADPTASPGGSPRKYLADAEAAAAGLKAAEDAVTKNDEVATLWDDRLQALNVAATAAKQRFGEDAQDAATAQSRVEDDKRSLRSKQNTQAIVSGVDMGIRPETIAAGADAERAFFDGGASGYTPGQAQDVNAMAEQLKGVTANYMTLLQAVSQMVQAHYSTQDIIAKIAQMAQRAQSAGDMGAQ